MYRGVDRPLVGSSAVISTHHQYHGKDGLNDAPDPNAPDLSHMQSEHAVVALIRLVNQYPGRKFVTFSVSRIDDAKCIVVARVCLSVCLAVCPRPYAHTTARTRM